MATRIDRAFCKTLREALEPALKEIGDRLGVSLTPGRASYAYDNGTMKIDVATIGEGGAVVTKERKALDQFESWLGFGFGATFSMRGEDFTVTGYNRRARKRPILADRSKDGKTFVFETASVKRLLGLAPSESGLS